MQVRLSCVGCKAPLEEKLGETTLCKHCKPK